MAYKKLTNQKLTSAEDNSFIYHVHQQTPKTKTRDAVSAAFCKTALPSGREPRTCCLLDRQSTHGITFAYTSPHILILTHLQQAGIYPRYQITYVSHTDISERRQRFKDGRPDSLPRHVSVFKFIETCQSTCEVKQVGAN